ncbi:hypothetical protein CGCF415_v005645 [Colletotrichum fructicola]|nr:hypothetical protein CGCFRS4_v007645 [Colletotrichum fructicola]KAF4909935.1 hypothetical protein CGCF415_v005645 [Colletotrichum fructicola]KAF4933881.1 hypothetical protein CGCF245_v009181 [Colletotrichum fructicola]
MWQSSPPADALRPGATFNFEVLLTPSTKEKMQRDEPSSRSICSLATKTGNDVGVRGRTLVGGPAAG